MRVLFLTRLYWPHIGGVEKHLNEISSRLSEKGYKVTIITTKHDKNLKEREKKGGVEVIRFTQPKIKYLGLLYTWLWMVKNIGLINKSDIVHCHDILIWYWPFKLIFPKKKVYTTFHGRWGKYPITRIDLVQKRIGAKFSAGVICIGEYIPKNYGISADILSYGAADKVKSRDKIKKDDKSIIYVGRLDKDIAFNNLLEVFSKLKGYKIEFCGDGELKKECEKYGEVHGFTDPRPFYQRAKYCFASGYLTILEALSYRCLVFTSYRHPLHKDYYLLSPFKKWIASSNSPAELVNKFRYLSKNKTETKKIINQGYNWARKQTWEKLTEQYLALWGVKAT